jgi:hypothetical protein
LSAPTSTTPTVEDLADLTPMERAKLITRIGNERRHTPADLARQRRADIRQLLAQGLRVMDLASWLGITPSRIVQLAKLVEGEAR